MHILLYNNKSMDFKDQILQLAERIQKQKDSIATEEQLPDGVVYMDKESGVVTTQEELDAYNIVRSILRKSVDVARITYRDYKSYFVVNLDNSQWFWICRISIGARKKQIGIPLDNYKSCEWLQIDSIDDIFKYAGKLEESLKMAIRE